MIIEYTRPKSIETAIELLERKTPTTLAIGGGSSIRQNHEDPCAVVDLQDLGLSYLRRENGKIHIGATTTLTQIEAEFGGTDLTGAIQIQASRNQRNTASLAGLVKKANGRSPILTTLLALDATLVWEPGEKTLSLGNWLPLRETWQGAVLIREVILPDVPFVFDSIARSPKDQPVICCAIAKWPNGRMRASVGGFGKIPLLIADGNSSDDLQVALQSALKEANDPWASAAYRLEAGMVLIRRLATRLLAQ